MCQAQKAQTTRRLLAQSAKDACAVDEIQEFPKVRDLHRRTCVVLYLSHREVRVLQTAENRSDRVSLMGYRLGQLGVRDNRTYLMLEKQVFG